MLRVKANQYVLASFDCVKRDEESWVIDRNTKPEITPIPAGLADPKNMKAFSAGMLVDGKGHDGRMKTMFVKLVSKKDADKGRFWVESGAN